MILIAHQLRVRRTLASTAVAGGPRPVQAAYQAPSQVASQADAAPDRAPVRGEGLVAGLRAGPMVNILRAIPGERTVPGASHAAARLLNPVGTV